MNIGWPRTFGLDLDLISRALSLYARQPNVVRSEVEAGLGIGGQKAQGVNSWLKFLGLRQPTKEGVTSLGWLLFEGDPHLRDTATLCVLHYILCTNPEATVWHEGINRFIPNRTRFTKDDLRNHFFRPEFNGASVKQLGTDQGLFLSTYAGIERRALQALGLLTAQGDAYVVQPVQDIPAPALAYCLYDRRARAGNESTTELRRLLNEEGSPGVVFHLTEDLLRCGLSELESLGLVSVVRVADIDGVSYRSNVQPLELLQQYYGVTQKD